MFRMLRAYLFILVLILIGLSSCDKTGQTDTYPEIFLDMEIASDSTLLARTDSSIHFYDLAFRSDKESRSGSYSVITSKRFNPYALSYRQDKGEKAMYIVASIWRKSINGEGILTCQSDDFSFNDYASEPMETDANGWERLELRIVVPASAEYKQINIFVWNPSNDTVYFDDLKIERDRKRIYPEYDGEVLALDLDTSEYLKIIEKRNEAMSNGILQTADDDWAKGILFGENRMMKAKARLKGDWLDHLRGDKWSFRIKISKGETWNRMRVFSVQTPAARNFLYEWLAHKFYKDNDILTSRYGFVPFTLNRRSLGIYAWEEHFDKILLEWNKRREGPILKFTEDAFWQTIKINEKFPDSNFLLPYFETSVIEPFGVSRTMLDSGLMNQFLIGQKLMKQYKDHSRKPTEIFDIKKLARFFAMSDILAVKHSFVWHNQRFYYNPVLCKLEPIAFDCYDESDIITNMYTNLLIYWAHNEKEPYLERFIHYSLFTDELFQSYYYDYLREFSDSSFVNNTLSNYRNQIGYNDSLLKKEFPKYHYDANMIPRNTRIIRNSFDYTENIIAENTGDPFEIFKIKRNVYYDSVIFEDTPEFFVRSYMEDAYEDSLSLSVFNYYPRDIQIVGTGTSSNYIDYYLPEKLSMKPFKSVDNVFAELSVNPEAKFLFFTLKANNVLYKIPIMAWPYPEGETPQQELYTKINLNDENLIDRIEGQNIFIKKKAISIDYPVIIPEGYKVIIAEGTEIDLTNGSMFISYSPIYIDGKQEDPVVIRSSDGTAQGFTVLQAEEISEINHTRFDNLNTLNYKGWTLTGAVNFYESDVLLNSVTFSNNQCEDALNIIRSEFKMEESLFENIFADAFDADFCNGEVYNTTFRNTGNDAFDCSGSEIFISGLNIDNANDKAISAGEDSYVIIENSYVSNSNIGLASKDLSVVEARDCVVSDCNYELVLFVKKPEFGPAKMILSNSTINNPDSRMLIERGSVLTIDGVSIEGTEENLYDLFYTK